jgi:hypothetical protein
MEPPSALFTNTHDESLPKSGPCGKWWKRVAPGSAGVSLANRLRVRHAGGTPALPGAVLARAVLLTKTERRRASKQNTEQGESDLMTDRTIQERASESNTIKDPEDWTTGDEPMTGAQRSYLHTLAAEAGEEVDDNLTKAEASNKIDELQAKTGRGTSNQE